MNFDQIFALTSDAAFISVDHVILEVNDAARELYDVETAADLVGRSIDELVPDEYRPSLRQRTTVTLEGRGRSREAREEILLADGARVPVLVRSCPIDYTPNAQLRRTFRRQAGAAVLAPSGHSRLRCRAEASPARSAFVDVHGGVPETGAGKRCRTRRNDRERARSHRPLRGRRPRLHQPVRRSRAQNLQLCVRVDGSGHRTPTRLRPGIFQRGLPLEWRGHGRPRRRAHPRPAQSAARGRGRTGVLRSVWREVRAPGADGRRRRAGRSARFQLGADPGLVVGRHHRTGPGGLRCHHHRRDEAGRRSSHGALQSRSRAGQSGQRPFPVTHESRAPHAPERRARLHRTPHARRRQARGRQGFASPGP